MVETDLSTRINSVKQSVSKIASEITGGRFSAHVVSVRIPDNDDNSFSFPTMHQSLDLILSNVVPSISFHGDTKEVSIHASAVICDGGVGKIYKNSNDTKIDIDPFVCADIEIIIASNGATLKEDIYPDESGLGFFFHMGERELYYILHLLCTGNLCIATVDAELCMIEDQKYIIVNRAQHIEPRLDFKFLTKFSGLHLSSKEIDERMKSNTPITLNLKT